jgi:cysteine dioxygenase
MFHLARPLLISPDGSGALADSLGLHKVGNPTEELAVSLHLYSPPYSRCRIWLDEANMADSHTPVINYFSEYGQLV